MTVSTDACVCHVSKSTGAPCGCSSVRVVDTEHGPRFIESECATSDRAQAIADHLATTRAGDSVFDAGEAMIRRNREAWKATPEQRVDTAPVPTTGDVVFDAGEAMIRRNRDMWKRK